MTALEELRKDANCDGCPSGQTVTRALLELAARLDALEAAHLKPIPRIGGGEIFPMPIAAPTGGYSLRPALGRPGDELPPQESVAKE